MEVLKGHETPETAYIVEDYPYGFRLRCKKRYWVEWKAGRGARLWEQTTNPKQGNLWTNKPKAGTFAYFGLGLFLDSNGHVAAETLSQYADSEQAEEFLRRYGEATPAEFAERIRQFAERKKRFEEKRARGVDTAVAIAEMRLEDATAAAERKKSNE